MAVEVDVLYEGVAYRAALLNEKVVQVFRGGELAGEGVWRRRQIERMTPGIPSPVVSMLAHKLRVQVLDGRVASKPAPRKPTRAGKLRLKHNIKVDDLPEGTTRVVNVEKRQFYKACLIGNSQLVLFRNGKLIGHAQWIGKSSKIGMYSGETIPNTVWEEIICGLTLNTSAK